MKNRIKIFTMFIFISFLITLNIVRATDELPDNGAIISSSQVIQTKTGTGPWDDNDEPGNDSSEDNNIVRSFDQVTWTIENTMVLNNTTADSYTGGRIYFEATLPDVFTSETAKWDLDSMGWIENAKLSSNKLTLTGYYHMSNEMITIPGKQTLVFVAKILGAANGIEFQPTIKTWITGNNEEDYIITIPKKTITSAAPRYNVVLLNNSECQKKTTVDYGQGNTLGRMYGYALVLQLHNRDASKELKGIEYPKGEISFDLDLKLQRSMFESTTLEDITEECTPVLWNYKQNDLHAYGIIPDRIMTFGSGLTRYLRSLPYGYKTTDRTKSTYKSGNIVMRQEASKIKVTVNDYGFDGIFPHYSAGSVAASAPIYKNNVGVIGVYYFQLFVPDNDATSVLDRNYYLKVNETNFNATSLSGVIQNEQTVNSDDTNTVQHVIYKPGTYNHYFVLYKENGNYLGASHDTGDASAVISEKIKLLTKFSMGLNNDSDIYSATKFIKFDGEAYQPILFPNGDKYQKQSFDGNMEFNLWYITKPDGTNWESQNEMNNTDINGMLFFENIEDIPEGFICVGEYLESKDGVITAVTGDNNSVIVMLKIKESAQIGKTYGITAITKDWEKYVDRTIYTIENQNFSEWPMPVWSSGVRKYVKTEYNSSNSSIVSGTHSGGGAYGQTVLILGASQGITIETENKKVNYDIGKNENTVKYKITPSLTTPDVTKVSDITGVTVTITDTLPKGLTYIPGSSNCGDPEITENDNGSTTLVWNIYNCTVGESIEPVTFDASIYAETLNGTQYENVAVISADNDIIGNTLLSKRTASNTIQITNLSSHRLYKTMNTPVIEKNGEIHFTLSYKNHTDETIPDFQLLDILPYNGDSRETNFTGTYTLDRIVVTQEDGSGNKISNDNLEILYTNDENARSATSKDENLGEGWTKISSENIKQSATAIAVKGEVGAQGKVNVDVYLKTANNKGLDKYVNSATAQVYKATEEMTTSNVVSQVVERKIEGIAWEDINANGIKDANEEVLKNIELALTDNLGNQVTDVNGNIVSSVRTDENGYYKFENLPKGNYYVNVTIFNSKYDITEKGKGTNTKINSKFNVEAKETDEITKLNSIDLPVLTVSNINVGFVKKATSIIVKHQTEDGEDLVNPETITGRVDEEYTTKEKEFDEYEIKTIPDNANGVMEEDVIEVIYVYSFVKGKITITKVDNNDNTKLLSGATFKIEKLNDTTFTAIEKTTGDNGIVEFTDLTIGKYRITETKAPNGYELKSTPIDVEISKNTKEQNIIATDKLKLQLPATGGSGLYSFMIIGIIIMILVVALRNNKVKKEN